MIEGRFWVSSCRVERQDDHLAVHLGGRGWRFIDSTSAGPLGSRFAARGELRFELTFDTTATVDLRYDEGGHRVLLELTPTEAVSARVSPIGSLPVVAQGGWSGVIGGIGALLGAPVARQADTAVAEEGTAIARRQLGAGGTLVVDLCTGQLDGALGPLEDGAQPAERPYPPDDTLWLDNARAELRPNGIDMSGPYPTLGRTLRVDVDVESGGPAEVSLVCGDEAAQIADGYIQRGRAGAFEALAEGRASAQHPLQLSLPPGRCATPVVVVRPSGAHQVGYRYRVVREGEPAAPWVRCDPIPAGADAP